MTGVWDILGIKPTDSKKEIRRAYAAKTKECHPEENPEGFELLSDAYKRALAYAEADEMQTVAWQESNNSIAGIEVAEEAITQDASVNVEGLPAEKSLLDIFAEKEQELLEEQLAKGILKDIVTLYEDEKLSRRNAEWEKLFLSDEFLTEQADEKFAENLYYYLEEKTEKFRLPIIQSFMIELTVAYGLMPYENYIPETGVFPGQKLVARLWNMQSGEWREQRGQRIMNKADNIVRVRAVNNYQILFISNRRGQIRADNHKVWEELSWFATNYHIYELNGRNLTNMSNSKNIIALYTYWFKYEEISEEVMALFYDRYNFRNLEGTSYRSYYLDMKEAMLNRYPDIEDYLYADEKKKDKAKGMMVKLKGISDKYSRQAKNLLEYDATDINAELKELLEDESWDKLSTHPVLKEWLAELYMIIRNPIDAPEYLSRWLNDYYADERFGSDKVIQKMRLAIARHIIKVDKCKEYKGYTYWEYFMTYGFGIRSMAVSIPEGKMFSRVWHDSFVSDSTIYLPEFIHNVYSSDRDEQRELLNIENGAIFNPRVYEFDYPFNHKLRMELHYHFVVYFYDDKMVTSWRVPYDEFEQIVGAGEGISPEAYFALLAITRIDVEHKVKARASVMEWLRKTPLLETTLGIIAECIINDNSPQMYGDNIFVAEQEDMCIMVAVYEEGFKLLRYSTTGLIGRYPRSGLDYSNMHPHDILRAHLKPVPKRVASIDVSSLSNIQKAEKIVEGMYMNESVRLGVDKVSDITHAYVMLTYKKGEYYNRYKMFAISRAGMGFDHKFMSDYGEAHMEYEREGIDKALAKAGVRGECIYYVILREESPESSTMIARSQDGIFYARSFLGGKNMISDTLYGLLVQMYEFDDVAQIDVYEGRASLSRLNRKPEYCFTEQDYRESRMETEVQTLAQYYTVF